MSRRLPQLLALGSLAGTAVWAQDNAQAAPPPLAVDRAVYELDVRIRPERQGLSVTGTVHFPPVSTERDTVAVVLSSWMTSLALDVAAPAGYGGGTLMHDSARGDRTWRLALPRTLPPGQPLTLRFSYEGDSLRAAQLRVTPAGSLAGGGGEIWYPRLGFDSMSVGTLRFEAPPGQTVLSNGVLDMGASRPDVGLFVYRVSMPARFAFVSAPYVRYSHAGSPRLRLLLLRDRPNAGELLERLAKTLRALESQFGDLPFPEYSIAEVEFGGATGATSEFGFFLANKAFFDAGLPLPFTGHELAHAWWGNMVGTKPGPGRMMLTEGIASFGMLRVIEQVEGEPAAEAYRASRYPGYETSGSPLEYFQLAAAGIDPPLGATTPRTQYEILAMHRMANTRGWFLLDMLSREIGRDRFAAILRGIVERYQWGAISWDEFRREVELGAAPIDVRWFFDDWFMHGGAPTLSLSVEPRGRLVRGVIRQHEGMYRVTVPLSLQGTGGRVAKRSVRLRDTTTSFAETAPFAVSSVILDAMHEVLRWTPDVQLRARREAPLTRADFQRRYGSVSQSIELYRAALDSIVEPDTSALRFAIRYGLAAALIATADTAAGRAELETALALRERRPALVPAAYLLLGRVAWAQSDTATASRAIRAALDADQAGSWIKSVTETIHGLPWAAAFH